MAKFFIIGETGDDRLWLVNTEMKTVQDLKPDVIDGEGAADETFLHIVQNMRLDGQVMVKNINVAIATNDRSDASATAHSSTPSR